MWPTLLTKVMTRLILGDFCLKKPWKAIFYKFVDKSLFTLGHVTKFVYKTHDKIYARFMQELYKAIYALKRLTRWFQLFVYKSLFTLVGQMTKIWLQKSWQEFTRRFMPWKCLQGDFEQKFQQYNNNNNLNS